MERNNQIEADPDLEDNFSDSSLDSTHVVSEIGGDRLSDQDEDIEFPNENPPDLRNSQVNNGNNYNDDFNSIDDGHNEATCCREYNLYYFI